MRRSRHSLRRRLGSHGPRGLWRVVVRGAEVGYVRARDYHEAMEKARRTVAPSDEGKVRVYAVT